MWNRIRNDLRQAIFRAVADAGGRGERDLSTLRFLSGLALDNDDPAARLLARLSATPPRLADAFLSVEPCEKPLGEAEPALTEAARLAVDRAYSLARDMGDDAVGGEHLLLAFLDKPIRSDAGRVLAEMGVTWEAAACELMAIQPERATTPPGVRMPGLARRRLVTGAKGKIRRFGRAAAMIARYPGEPFLQYMVARTRIGADPYPYYTRLRKQPFRWDRMIRQWFVTGYDDVRAVLQEQRFSTQQYTLATRNQDELPPIVDREFRSLDRSIGMHVLFLDAPKQTRIRSLVVKQFTPRVIARMEARIQEITDSLLTDPVKRGRLNVIADLAVPLPGLVIEQMLGVSDVDSAEFKRWSDAYIAYIGSGSSLALDHDAYLGYHRLRSYFRGAIALRRAEPRDDVLTLLLQSREGDDRLTDEEVIANCLLMLAVGRETTTQFIGNTVLALLRNPGQWARLRENPELIQGALEESLRYDSPVQWTVRIARETFEWNGRRFEKGDVLNVAVGAANRDPAQFPDPDRLDVARGENRHIAFGYGPHFCLGAALARLEGMVVLRTLLRRFPDMRLAQNKFQWRGNTTFRAVKSLEVALNP